MPAGKTVIKKNVAPTEFYALLEGGARVMAPAANGQELFLRTLRAGDVFGEIGLADQYRQYGQYGEGDDAGSVLIGRRFTQGTLAQMVGTTREGVNRQISTWEREGVLARESKLLRILRSDNARKPSARRSSMMPGPHDSNQSPTTPSCSAIKCGKRGIVNRSRRRSSSWIS